MERLAPGDVARDDVLDHARHEVRGDGRDVDLPEALDPRVGLELEEDEVPAAVARGRIAHDERADARDLHGAAGSRRAVDREHHEDDGEQRDDERPGRREHPEQRAEGDHAGGDLRAAEDAIEDERAATPERRHPEEQADRVVEVRQQFEHAERDVDAPDDAAEDGDQPRPALRRHARDTTPRRRAASAESGAQNLGQLRRADVAAAADERHAPSGEPLAQASAPPASGAAPAASTRLRVVSIIVEIAARISSSETRRKSSSRSHRIALRQLEGRRASPGPRRTSPS